MLLDKPYRTQLEVIYAASRLHVPKSRYHVILSQRHFQVSLPFIYPLIRLLILRPARSA